MLGRHERILGGKNSRPGKFPHQVSLQSHNVRNSHFCGASIIALKWIISAAHCITNPDGSIEKYCRGYSCRAFKPEDFDVVAGVFDIDAETKQPNLPEGFKSAQRVGV
jgi:hypothetical protein